MSLIPDSHLQYIFSHEATALLAWPWPADGSGQAKSHWRPAPGPGPAWPILAQLGLADGSKPGQAQQYLYHTSSLISTLLELVSTPPLLTAHSPHAHTCAFFNFALNHMHDPFIYRGSSRRRMITTTNSLYMYLDRYNLNKTSKTRETRTYSRSGLCKHCNAHSLSPFLHFLVVPLLS